MYPSTFLKYHSGIQKAHHILTPTRRWEMQVIAVIGAPGVGKTTTILERYPSAYWWSGTKWFDSYCGEAVVVFDEFHGNLPFTTFKRVCDPTPLDVEVKGSTVRFCSKTVIFIANSWPHEWYDYDKLGRDAAEAVRRRLGRVWHVTTDAWVDVTAGRYGILTE